MNRRLVATTTALLALVVGGAALAAPAEAPKTEPAQNPTLQVTYYYLPG